jgi:methyl-accepting chemotaxis protein
VACCRFAAHQAHHRVVFGSGVGDSLRSVTSPELYRRVDRAEQDLTAISDTLLDIKETVDQHTDELASIKRIQGQHSEVLNQHSEILNQHSEVLNQHSEILNQHSEILNQHTELLNEILRRLETR